MVISSLQEVALDMDTVVLTATGEAPAPQIKTFLFSVAGNRAFPGIYSL